MYRNSFSRASSSFPGGLVDFIRPKQMFVENMLFVEDPPPPNTNLLDSVVFTIAPGPNVHSQIKVDFSENSIDTFVVLLGKTQVTQPSVSEMKAFGTSISGSFTTYTFTGLDQNANYYASILVVKGTNEFDAKASTPTFVKTLPYTIPIPKTPSNFAISQSDMPYGSSSVDTPYSGIQNVPAFLVGVLYTKTIGNSAYRCAFDSWDLHAYCFEQNDWT
jgi:hypothetical protein